MGRDCWDAIADTQHTDYMIDSSICPMSQYGNISRNDDKISSSQAKDFNSITQTNTDKRNPMTERIVVVLLAIICGLAFASNLLR